MLLFEHNIKLNPTHRFVIKIPYKRELKQTAFNNSSDIDFQDFSDLFKRCTVKLYLYLVIDATLASDNSLQEQSFRNNIKVNHDNGL